MTRPEQPPPPDPWTVGPTPPPSQTSWPTPPYGQQPAPWSPPPYGQQQPSWPAYPTPPRPRRRWVLWVVLAGVLAVGGCGALVATFGVRFYKEIDGAKVAVNDYLTAVEHHDTATAQGLLCDEAQTDAVTRAVDAGILQHHVVGVIVQTSHTLGSDAPDRKHADVTVDVTLAGGVRHRDVVDVAYEHQRWLVCGVIRSSAR